MTMLYDAKEFSSLSDMVYHHLYEAITDGRYHSGDLLIEMKIAEELGVSRTTICKVRRGGYVVAAAGAQPNPFAALMR